MRGLIRIADIIRGKSVKDKEIRAAYTFVMPCVLFFIFTFICPTFYAFWLTLHKWSFVEAPEFVGFKQYIRVFHDSLFWKSMKNTFVLALFSVPPTMALALAVALLFNAATKFPFRRLFRAIYFLPVITSPVAIAFVWDWLYQPQFGLFNAILTSLGLPRQMWLTSATQVLPSLAFMNIWARLGFDMIIFWAGLQGIPRIYYEAAMIDGAGSLQRFRHITLPLLNPHIILVAVFELINTLKIFDIPYIATRGGPANASRVAVLHIYDLAFTWNRIGEASVAALFLFATIMVASVLQWRILRRPVEY
jgi:multiple sugar transport system permease protein